MSFDINRITQKNFSVIVPAKINLTLKILNQHSNGYHNLESITCFVDIGERLEAQFVMEQSSSLEIISSFTQTLSTQDNLILKAQQWFINETGINISVAWKLHKAIPIAAGLGGGSSDAASTIRLLEHMTNTKILPSQIAKLATLGSDIPACYYARNCIIGDLGENITPISIAFKEAITETPYFILINPIISVSTKEMFTEFDRLSSSSFKKQQDHLPIDKPVPFEWITQAQNDFESIVCAKFPEVKSILHKLKTYPDCMLARLSGSGGTCFGLFANQKNAQFVLNDVQKLFPWAKLAAYDTVYAKQHDRYPISFSLKS